MDLEHIILLFIFSVNVFAVSSNVDLFESKNIIKSISDKSLKDNKNAALPRQGEKEVINKPVSAVSLVSDVGFIGRAYERARQRLATDMDLGFIHAFLSSLAMILVSELGDKTFFIAAIMAMKHSRTTVFLGAIGALALMTVLSAILGFATTIIPKSVTHIISSILFLVFGIKMLNEGYQMGEEVGKEEYEEVQADLRKREAELQSTSSMDIESGVTRTPGRRWFNGIVSTVFLQSFILTFLAEWGDRSQITTIILAAREEVIGVILGGTLGHCICTGLAVLGGRFIAQKISIRTVTLIGGVVFIIFAFSSFIVGD